MSNSIILIGMPGCGKSSLGVILAKELALKFIDTDLIIQHKHQCTLQQIVDNRGYVALREIEQQVLLELNETDAVIATGGSVVYSESGMQRLQQLGIIIFLDVGLDELKSRIHNYQTRGIAKRADQTFQDLYNERQLLYNQYAQYRVDCNQLSLQQSLQAVLNLLQ